jgi:hypothetical protein
MEAMARAAGAGEHPVGYKQQSEAMIDATPTLADAIEKLAQLLVDTRNEDDGIDLAVMVAGLKARINDLAGGSR